MPSLEKFHWNNLGQSQSESYDLQFLQANSQLQQLSFTYPIPSQVLEFQLLPLLSTSFLNLKSLDLQWESASISNRALTMISALKSVNRISLSAGKQFEWLIDHQSMRQCLHKLPLLRKIAFSRDSYDKRIPGSQAGDYYLFFDLTEQELGELHNFQSPREAWEHIHRQSVLREADTYLEIMPQLEWLFFGQIPMSVSDDRKAGKKVAQALSGRDDCSTLLRRMFGGRVD